MNINRLDQEYLKSLTVLYVEDDADTRDQFSEFLRRPVDTLITASNGAEGLEAFIKYAPDIVVTDILMPHMDGLTMSYEIRGMAPAVPIIVITAFEQTDYLMRAINIGVDKYVTKPVNSYLLFECLLECAHRLRAEEQLKLEHQREIQAMWAKHHKTVAILAGGIAHDYNNLLQSILGFVSLAELESDPESKYSKYLQQVDKCSDEARNLSQMLTILGEGESERKTRGSIMPLFQHTIEKAISNTPIQLVLDFPEQVPMVNYIEHQLHLVFTSLSDNAIEAMTSGGTIFLSTQTTLVTEQDLLPLLPGNYLHVSLVDTGTGMPPEVLSRVFDPYFSTKQRCSQRGMGLSLAICHTIIMKHGGIITADSTPGNGSTFHIWLPIVE